MFMLVLMGGLFMVDNQEFFGQVEKQVEQGYQWEYVGKQSASNDVPNLTILDKDGKPTVYFKLTEGK